jgi:hypothetical protein
MVVGATGGAKAAIYDAISQLEKVAVLRPRSKTQRNQSWEPVGLFDLITAMEAVRLWEQIRRHLAGERPWTVRATASRLHSLRLSR